MKPTISIAIADWWDHKRGQEAVDSNTILSLLTPYFDFVYSENPDFLLYSCFGDTHLRYTHSAIKIFYTGENVRTDWNLCDYGIDFDFMEFGRRHLYIPLLTLGDTHTDFDLALKKHIREKPESRERFCAFMVTNGGGHPLRGEVFERLNAYKKVDSGGKWRNNIGMRIEGGPGDIKKHEWLKHYKFHLCFENSSSPGYVTEKIIQAFSAGCVPIYWGDPTLCDPAYARYRPVFNPKSFINAHDFTSLDELCAEVARLDNDDRAFQAMLCEPMLLNDPCNEKWLQSAVGGGKTYIPLYLRNFLAIFLLPSNATLAPILKQNTRAISRLWTISIFLESATRFKRSCLRLSVKNGQTPTISKESKERAYETPHCA